MRLGLVPILEVEAEVIYKGNSTLPLSGQTFYVLEKSPDDLLRGDVTSEIWYAKTMNALRNHALTFFITDSQGGAEVKNLKTGIYYICGIGHTQQEVVIWNVQVNMQYGKNRLVLDNSNMIGK